MLSDIHYDPGYATPNAFRPRSCADPNAHPMGQSGCDSPWALMESAFADIAANTPENSYLIFTGDWLKHNVTLEESAETFRNLTRLVKGLPHTTIPAPAFSITSLGNNDFIPDYYFDVNSTDESIAAVFGSLLLEADLINEAENKTFAKAAYYSRDLPALGLKFLVLNTLPYSLWLEPEIDPDEAPDPTGQFAWMREELAAAKASNTSVVLISHIPPTMNSFHCVTSPDTQLEPFVKGAFLETMRDIVTEYNGTVIYQFYGHAHAFNYLADPTFPAPGVVVPAVTKIFGNHASYMTVEFDDVTRTFSNFRMRSQNITDGTWHAYVGANGETTIDAELGPMSTLDEMRAVAEKLFTNKTVWDRYEIIHAGGEMADMWAPLQNPASRTVIPVRHTCSIIAFSDADYRACLAERGRGANGDDEKDVAFKPGYIALIAAAGAGGIGLLVFIYVYAKKKLAADKANDLAPLNTEASA